MRAALKYLRQLSDENALYHAALGSYDLDLVVMVAQILQKDPKEYVPFLTSLDKMDPPLRRHAIDMHLKRYERALANLAQVQGDSSYA